MSKYTLTTPNEILVDSLWSEKCVVTVTVRWTIFPLALTVTPRTCPTDNKTKNAKTTSVCLKKAIVAVTLVPRTYSSREVIVPLEKQSHGPMLRFFQISFSSYLCVQWYNTNFAISLKCHQVTTTTSKKEKRNHFWIIIIVNNSDGTIISNNKEKQLFI